MTAAGTTSGDRPSRSHAVGFVGLGLAVALTFLVLWAAFFRVAPSEVSPRVSETAPEVTAAPAPVVAPSNNEAKSAAAPKDAPPSREPPATGSTPAPQAPDVDHVTGSQEGGKFDQLRNSVAEAGGALTIETLSPDRVKTTYEDIADDYAVASSGVGALTSDTRPAQVQAAVRQAASAYEVWIRQLQSTAWPPEVQPYVDNYLALAKTKGRALFRHGLHAKSVEDLQGAQAIQDTFELSHALELMRGAMGVSD